MIVRAGNEFCGVNISADKGEFYKVLRVELLQSSTNQDPEFGQRQVNAKT